MARPFLSSTPAAPAQPASSESKPLPDPKTTITGTNDRPEPQRPGTSGTEAALKTTRRRASERLRQAERAERAYRARKRSAATRANYAEAKHQFAQAREHFGLAIKLLTAVVRGLPYVLSEKREARRATAEEAKRRKVMEKRKRLDEKLGKAAGEDEGEEMGEGQ